MEMHDSSPEQPEKTHQFHSMLVNESFDVETQWYERAKTQGLSEPMRNFMKERIVAHLLDAGKVRDETRRLLLQGRVVELQELLGLFSV